jgi:NADH-quinone oxidoreductase subunit J
LVASKKVTSGCADRAIIINGTRSNHIQIQRSVICLRTAKGVGTVLFRDFILPFEVASILFISAMVGAVILGKKHVND